MSNSYRQSSSSSTQQFSTSSSSKHVTYATGSGQGQILPDNRNSEWEWDVKLNKLLEDLQTSIGPLPSHSHQIQAGDGSNRHRRENSPAAAKWNEGSRRTEETFLEYKKEENIMPSQQQQPFYLSQAPQPDDQRYHPYSGHHRQQGQQRSQHLEGIREFPQGNKNIYSNGGYYLEQQQDDGGYSTANQSQIQYMDASNSVTVLKSMESSPIPPPDRDRDPPTYGNLPNSIKSPRLLEKREHISHHNISYTKNITGEPPPVLELEQDFEKYTPPTNYPVPTNYTRPPQRQQTHSVKYNDQVETRHTIGQPLFSSTPKPNGAIKNTGSVRATQPQTSPDPPYHHHIRNESYKTSCKDTSFDTTTTSMDDYDYNDSRGHTHTRRVNHLEPESPPTPTPVPQYYTATTTRTESRESNENPLPSFPTRNGKEVGNGRVGEPPKRLDELLATFDESFIETSRIVGDGGGPHKSHPYGPGTHPILRSVRIQESVNDTENEFMKRSASTRSKTEMQNNNNNSLNMSNAVMAADVNINVAGPPVFYPVAPNEQLFSKTSANQSSLQIQNGGQGKGRMKRSYESKESAKYKREEKSGGGAVPVPVCLPVCCAAPCVIM